MRTGIGDWLVRVGMAVLGVLAVGTGLWMLAQLVVAP